MESILCISGSSKRKVQLKSGIPCSFPSPMQMATSLRSSSEDSREIMDASSL